MRSIQLTSHGIKQVLYTLSLFCIIESSEHLWKELLVTNSSVATAIVGSRDALQGLMSVADPKERIACEASLERIGFLKQLSNQGLDNSAACQKLAEAYDTTAMSHTHDIADLAPDDFFDIILFALPKYKYLDRIYYEKNDTASTFKRKCERKMKDAMIFHGIQHITFLHGLYDDLKNGTLLDIEDSVEFSSALRRRIQAPEKSPIFDMLKEAKVAIEGIARSGFTRRYFVLNDDAYIGLDPECDEEYRGEGGNKCEKTCSHTQLNARISHLETFLSSCAVEPVPSSTFITATAAGAINDASDVSDLQRDDLRLFHGLIVQYRDFLQLFFFFDPKKGLPLPPRTRPRAIFLTGVLLLRLMLSEVYDDIVLPENAIHFFNRFVDFCFYKSAYLLILDEELIHLTRQFEHMNILKQ